MNQFTRRRFIEATAVLGLAGSSSMARALGGVAATPLTRSWFAPYLGTAFTICDAAGRRAEMKLASLDSVRHTRGFRSSEMAAQQCFSARYLALKGAPKIDGLCSVEHAQLGTFALFLTPVGQRGNAWEAVFNRTA